jgi:hypothetical protein
MESMGDIYLKPFLVDAYSWRIYMHMCLCKGNITMKAQLDRWEQLANSFERQLPVFYPRLHM